MLYFFKVIGYCLFNMAAVLVRSNLTNAFTDLTFCVMYMTYEYVV